MTEEELEERFNRVLSKFNFPIGNCIVIAKQYASEQNEELKKEIERLKGDNERLKEFSEYNPVDDNSLLCDVEGCNMGPVSGGIYWRENGYWHLCSAHSFLGLEGEPMPQMKQSSIDREGRRDQYGILR